MIVDPAVRSLVAADPATASQFVAACVERCAQLFTGARGEETGREEDVARYLKVIDDLWDRTLPRTAFAGEVEFIESLPEMHPVVAGCC